MLSWLWEETHISAADFLFGKEGNAGWNRARQPLPASLVLGAHLDQVAQQHLHYTSALLCYPRAAAKNALPVYLCTLHHPPAPALGTISGKAVPWLGSQPHPTKMQLVLQNCLYSRALPSTAGQGRITISSLSAELVRLQEAWNADTAEIKAARNKVSRKNGLKPSLFWPFLSPSRTAVT